MATIKPFICVRPAPSKAAKIAALPYDVYNREEAKAVVKKNPRSFLAIDRAETSFPDEVDTYDPRVYEKASALLQDWIDKGWFLRDEEKCYYIYELTMDGRVQTGIVACASIDDYESGVIKKHENTRADKEQDRINHVDKCSAQTGPIFLAYRAKAEIRNIVAAVKKETPLYDFTSEDGIRHRVFRIGDTDRISKLEEAFASIDKIYIADGHHRAASAVKVGQMRRKEHPDYTGEEEFNYFLSVLFPDEELMIMDYNRVVKDLNGLTEGQFLKAVEKSYDMAMVEKVDVLGATRDMQQNNTSIADSMAQIHSMQQQIKPAKKGEMSLFIDGNWYICKAHPEIIPNDPVEGLDVSVLQNQVLDPILGIKDPKTDKRIDFVGGIRGLRELESRCRTDCRAAFAMYPTSIAELFAVADAGRLMPPKSTWFEPKLRSGLFIHEIER